MAQATAIGALIGGVTAGAGKAIQLWRAGELFAEDAAAGVPTSAAEAAAEANAETAAAADGGENVNALARAFRAVDVEGREITFPEGTVDHMMFGPHGNHFEQIISKFDLSSYEDVFGMIRSTVESVQPFSDQPGFLIYEESGLRVVVNQGLGNIVWTAYPV
jgi:hypothetical protein